MRTKQMMGKRVKHIGVATLVCMGILWAQMAVAQDVKPVPAKKAVSKVLYGTASFYANKFHGRKTASGEIFSQTKFTCACNVLPMGTWVRVTNMRNGKSVVVKVNDRLHPKMRRLLDLTRAGAQKLGYVNAGLTRVKAEVLGKNYRP